MYLVALSFVLVVLVWVVSRAGPPRLRVVASVGYLIAAVLFLYGAFTGIFFYAEPGFKYHVRTITGEEKMISDTGYNSFLFGRVNAWKNAMSVQAT